MEAQRYPDDFDGIVAGAPVFDYQRLNAGHVWMAQSVFAEQLCGQPRVRQRRRRHSREPHQVGALRRRVLAKCDAADGIRDRVIDDPQSCRFDPHVDLRPDGCAPPERTATNALHTAN